MAKHTLYVYLKPLHLDSHLQPHFSHEPIKFEGDHLSVTTENDKEPKTTVIKNDDGQTLGYFPTHTIYSITANKMVPSPAMDEPIEEAENEPKDAKKAPIQ